MTSKVWFITGAARGFGRVWAEAALDRGDKVVATARKTNALNGLVERHGDRVLPLVLDVTDVQQVRDAVAQAHRHFGQLDVVLNNAGYALVGAIEEARPEDVKAEFETNFFGALRVIQAALPILRNQKSGHILGVSSVAGIVAGAMTGFYNASKWALEALHDSLAQEVAAFGIKVTLIEPGAYATDFSSPMSLQISEELEDYTALRQQIFAQSAHIDFGEPQATAQAVLQIVDAAQPPLRFFLGTEGMSRARAAYAARLAEWEQWEIVSNAAQGASTRQTIKA
ncbi:MULTISPECIES: SDR family NAD(P)-dependent oxidoreductase [Gammaproteobacteria]|uniref:SDR family NAD(P)-dependent oxidoreductase n=2 Tax=Enterobacteriaceae TaxID=543 RepID=A0AAI9HEG2_CITFR|nr:MULTISPECIES: SDR family NAD(P)-dependent oxidoreductase [Enterobacteriaceae]EKV7198507.1 SDR family NAD(P)-dependent oxidoreductase [Citrobacter freundii]KLP95891.1 short-chain dehydrogenase [Enterobacter roggenkampii]RNT50145.1 SDR family NAD(P)-dependent oxidoreductase [Klebsiella quasipneumoniae subsp. quasipneumoniae]HDZ2291591.1 SDR family NAD(P)-dependent oxidoreductase [Klebsiella pneumoniae]